MAKMEKNAPDDGQNVPTDPQYLWIIGLNKS